MTAARGVDGGFQPGFASRSAAGGLPGLMIAVSAVGSGVVEAFCARLRHRQLPFGVLDSESGRPMRATSDAFSRSKTPMRAWRGDRVRVRARRGLSVRVFRPLARPWKTARIPTSASSMRQGRRKAHRHNKFAGFGNTARTPRMRKFRGRAAPVGKHFGLAHLITCNFARIATASVN